MNSSTRIIPMLFSGSREYRWTAANKMKKQKTPGAGSTALHLGIAEKQNKSSGKLKEIKSCGQEAHKRLEKSTSCYPNYGSKYGSGGSMQKYKNNIQTFWTKSKRKSPEIGWFQDYLWHTYRSWIQCTMFWRHGALLYGFSFDCTGTMRTEGTDSRYRLPSKMKQNTFK